jgi:heptose-I-phosphate ethanolaminephosphotransferase
VVIAGLLVFVVLLTVATLDSYVLHRRVAPQIEYDFSLGNGAVEIGNISKDIARPSDRLRVSLSFKINGNVLQHRIGDGYQNIFQTSQGNNGIRLELSTNEGPNSRMGLVASSALGESLGMDLGRMPIPGSWHDFVLEVVDGKLDVWLDGVAIGTVSGVVRDLPLDDVAIGTGFSKQRPFNGQVRNFQISRSIGVFDESSMFTLYVVSGSLAMCGWLVFVFFRYRSHGYEPTFSRTIKAGTVLLSVASLFGVVLLLTPVQGSIALYFTYLSWCVLALAIIASLRGFLGSGPNSWAVGGLIAAICYLGFLLYAAAATYLGHLDRNSGILSAADASAVFQSSSRESVEFLVLHFSTRELLFIFLIPVFPSLGVLMAFFSEMYAARRSILVLPALVMGICVPLMYPTGNSVAAELVSAYAEYQRSTDELIALINERRLTHAITASKKDQGELYLVVIGESANRDHMSAYGYFRKTTPWMDQKTSDPSWIIFDNAYTSFSHTVPSLTQALSQANQYNDLDIRRAPTLIELMNTAGFDTYWIDEQGSALGDTPLNAIAQVSKQNRYVRPLGQIKNALRDILESMDRGRNNLVVLHLMGSHADYARRVPDAYGVRFNDGIEELGDIAKDKEFVEKVLDPYDRSIHYTDRLISELWDMTKTQVGEPSVFVYFSDHGEDVYGKKFHDASRFTYSMVRSPLVMQFSPQWIARNPHRFETLRRNRGRVFTLDLLFETMTGMSGIQEFKYDHRYDLGDDQYALDERDAVTMRADGELDKALYADSGVRFIRDDPQFIARRNVEYLNATYGNKVMSVHNDMKNKLYESAFSGFKGVEFNIGIPSMKMGHYPQSVYPVDLDQFLAYDATKQFQRYWFDMKVENGYSLVDALDKLEELDRRFDLKKRALIESWDDDLVYFSEKGWRTSYYMHEDRWKKCGKFDVNVSECAKEIAAEIKKTKATSVSFFFDNYAFVKRYLEPMLPKDIGYHTFGLPAEYDIFRENFIVLSKRSPVFADRRVETILLESSHRFGETISP